ncbi:MAG TPA: VanZ family protein [Epulopiscium sp.]|nr:VanZ family protein [Candidatus Epulonipiscium sp.]
MTKITPNGTTKLKTIFPWLLVILWMAVIFYLSHQPATQSSHLSSGVAELIMNILEKITPSGMIDFELFHHFVRKNAHFFAYLILGILVVNAIKKDKGISIPAAALICILYAASDEFHQTFIPGRAGQLMDVLIDSSGSIVGILLYKSIDIFKGKLLKVKEPM